MLEQLKDLAQLAPLLTSIVAAVGVGVAWKQLDRNRTNQRETTAKGIWRDYLRLAIEHPDFAFGRYNEAEQSKYEWFIAYLLWGAEEILEFDASWERNVEVTVGYHRQFYRAHPKWLQEELPLYGEKVKTLVQRQWP
jgi:hypothetical protein